MATFLLEVRTEEIPAAALPGARRQLAGLFKEALAEAGLAGASVTALSTSRRLAVIIRDLAERQPDRTEELTGPPVRVAFSENGSPTSAGEGFARKVGLPVDQITKISTDKGEYLAATIVHEGRPTAEILSTIVPAVTIALRFPKMMRWAGGDHLFVRPVHGLVVLLDEAVVPCEVFGVSAGRTTVGHPVHAPEAFGLAHAEDYSEALAERGVIVDPTDRRQRLEQLATVLAEQAGARVHKDSQLMAEHVELVEWPGLVAGAFDEKYLGLPPEVVVTTLRHHQKCLIMESGDGGLRAGFIAVIDRKDDPEGLVRQGNEWVIGARLADASFFFAEDLKGSMTELAPGLDRLEFHRALGSLGDKTDRVGELAVHIARALGADVESEVLRSTARLAKTDLLTHMIGEFPELQGVMGGHYLRLEGASDSLWTAVRDHYQPVGFEGPVPESDIGKLLGVADRLDTLIGLFAVGERPSGSKDPFGLRRAAQGAVKIVAAAGWSIDLEEVIAVAVRQVDEYSEQPAADIERAVSDFLSDRVRRWLTDVAGVDGDTADAVMAVGWSDLPDAMARANALQRVRESDSFRSLALAFKRVRNITEGQPDAEIETELFEHLEERELHEATVEFTSALEELLPARRVEDAFAAMEPLADVLERFFIEVLVMCEDERVRLNRIALLKELGRQFMNLADLSKLQIEGGES